MSDNPRAYIHEFIDIRGTNRSNYMHHMAANWSPAAQEDRNQLLFGIWAVLGSTGPWPQVCNIWEEQGLDGLARSFGREAVGPGLQDPALERWWNEAAEFRRGGFDRILLPAVWMPTIEQWMAAGLRADVFAHEILKCRPGTAPDLLNLARASASPAYDRFGWTLAGAWTTAMRDDDEAVLLWAVPGWQAWADAEAAQRSDEGLLSWRSEARLTTTDWHRILLVAGPLCPFRTGRQPGRDDQREPGGRTGRRANPAQTGEAAARAARDSGRERRRNAVGILPSAVKMETMMNATANGDRYTIVSADCHAGGDIDDYRPYLPSRLHADFDAWKQDYLNPFDDLQDSKRVRNWDNSVRLRDLEADGQVAEVVFPNTVPPFFPSSLLVARPPATTAEFEQRWAGLQAHNRWLVDWCGQLPGRRAGLAQVFPNDMDAAVGEVEWAADNGLSGVLVPAIPPDSPVPPLWSDYYDPLWAACQDTGLSVNQHGGAGIPDLQDSPNRAFLMLMEVPFFANRSLWHLIVSGVFERFKKLRFVMTEQRVGWVPATLSKMDAYWRLFTSAGTVGEMPADPSQLPDPPSSYFSTNCYMGASFPGRDEAEAIRQIGVDRFMWGSDYPHSEGTFPDSVASLRHVFCDWSEGDLRRLLGGTAAEVYSLDLDALASVGVGPTVAEVAEPLTELPDNPSMAFRFRP